MGDNNELQKPKTKKTADEPVDDDKYVLLEPEIHKPVDEFIDDKYVLKEPKKYKNFPDDAHKALLKKIPPIQFRWDWGALPPTKPDVYLKFPVPTVIFTYTGGEECNTLEECRKLIKETQIRDMKERGLTDIQYSFYIGGDGKIYEGVGWIVQAAKDPEFAQWTGTSYDVAYMGDYSDNEPELSKIKLGKLLLNYMYDHNLIKEEYELIPLKKSRKLKLTAVTNVT